MEPNTATGSKVKSLKDASIPYILNGELYKILTQHGDNVTVRCSSCPSDRVYRGSVRSTGNFHMHIKRRHPELLGKLHEMKVGSLIERRERLLNAKKLVIRGRIKKESSGSGETVLNSNEAPTECRNIVHPIDYSCRNDVQPPEQVFTNTQQPSPAPTENEPHILIATEVHCDSNANMGIQRTPVFFTTTIKEETSSLDDEQAMDLTTTTNSRRSECRLSLPMSNLKWEEVLERVENSLQNLQHEMRTRNQIETNRIFLDLAKFKFLNPGFRYQS